MSLRDIYDDSSSHIWLLKHPFGAVAVVKPNWRGYRWARENRNELVIVVGIGGLGPVWKVQYNDAGDTKILYDDELEVIWPGEVNVCSECGSEELIVWWRDDA